jgi:hypothetical protein
LPAVRDDLPSGWPEWGERRVAGNGDELEEIARVVDLNPLEQRITLEIWIRLWRGG